MHVLCFITTHSEFVNLIINDYDDDDDCIQSSSDLPLACRYFENNCRMQASAHIYIPTYFLKQRELMFTSVMIILRRLSSLLI